jgi:hypothetical protein
MRARYSALALLCTGVQPGSMPHLRADAAVLFHALRRSARVPHGGTWISGPLRGIPALRRAVPLRPSPATSSSRYPAGHWPVSPQPGPTDSGRGARPGGTAIGGKRIRGVKAA